MIERTFACATSMLAAFTAAAPDGLCLSLPTARRLVARAGVKVGTVFADEQGNRFPISQVHSSSPETKTFVVMVRFRTLH